MDFGTGLQIAGSLGGLFGGSGKGQNAANQFQWNREWQIEQYKNRMQWIKEDADKAGVHILSALGAPLGSPATASYGDASSQKDIGGAIQNMGQGISRAQQAFGSREEREILKASAALDLENKQLQNERLRTEIRLATQPGSPPGFTVNPAIAGQGDFRVNPAEMASSDPSNRGIEAGRGNAPLNVEVRTYDGGTSIVPSQEYADAMESNIPLQLDYIVRNMIPYYFDKLGNRVRKNAHKLKKSPYYMKKGG